MKNLPNCISLSRIILSILLLFIKPLSLVFYVIYIICGLSDILDGTIARVTQTTSSLGARLDSSADFIMVVVLLFVLYPVVNPPGYILIWMVLIGVVRFISLFIAKVKFRQFVMLHTIANKATGLVLFVFPLFLLFMPKELVMIFVCILASLSATEELIIHLVSHELKINRSSILVQS